MSYKVCKDVVQSNVVTISGKCAEMLWAFIRTTLKFLGRSEKLFESGFSCFVVAILAVWSSYTSPLYNSNSTSPLSAPITQLEDSLLGSIPALGSMIGTAIAAPILDKFGRKNGGILLGIPFVISWAIIGISTSIHVILAARFLGGIPGGVAMVYGPIVVSEVSEDSIRGFLASVSMFQYCSGMLLSYVMGFYLSYRAVIWTNIVISIGYLGLLMFMEETPLHLVKKKKYTEARSSIAKYKGVPPSSLIVAEELTRLRQQIMSTADPKNVQEFTAIVTNAEEEKQLNDQNIQPSNKRILSSLEMLFTSRSSRRAFIVINMLMALMIFSGMVPVQVYANIVFTEADSSRSDLYTMIFAAVQFVATGITSIVADKIGRRLLQIGSSVAVALCLVALGYTLQFDVVPPEVTVLLIMMYSFFFMAGVGSVPYVLLAEVFVPEILNCASMLVIEWMWLLNFIIIGVFPYLTDLVGIYGTFYGFAIVSCANAIISYCILPETAGLSNEDIQLAFLKGEKKGEII